MQLGFYFNQSRCSGCFTCVVACKDWYDIPAGPVFWRTLSVIEQNRFPDVNVNFLSLSCCHCDEPSCRSACPADAVFKRKEDGIVEVDREACLGLEQCGGFCRTACPYGAPQFGMETNAKMQKCNFCLDRWMVGKKPICVESCPTHALDAGPMDELERTYGQNREAVGFTVQQEVNPAIRFKTKRN